MSRDPVQTKISWLIFAIENAHALRQCQMNDARWSFVYSSPKPTTYGQETLNIIDNGH